ncbi:MAG: hypothetical protein R3C14_36720 [Caldilineaceae bacterium]
MKYPKVTIPAKSVSAEGQSLIETEHFPIEFLSQLAERESWRKELYRPIYHLHKWWAKRLGSIFRGLLLGCLLPADAVLEDEFYQIHNFDQISIFDPFMGSGTTIGEAHKLGCSALGRDINPIACESVRVAMGPMERQAIQHAYAHLAEGIGKQIQTLYRSTDRAGNSSTVLYYFWVKVLDCPHCQASVDLFSTRIIARNAYPQRKPEVQVCCPGCSAIFPALYQQKLVDCPICRLEFNPHIGNVKGAKAECPTCQKSFTVVAVVQATGQPPQHRLYAKLVLSKEGEKQYLAVTPADLRLYAECKVQLAYELNNQAIKLPTMTLTDGYNTRQALNYHYDQWRDFFNDRQLLALGWLHKAIGELPDPQTRDLFLLLFSGVLEFNNLFASYKGEGTGAVRHMFAHHILKPERMPIEANLWGTAKSSGSFSNLFKTRVQRALDYRHTPFEVTTEGSGKAFQTNLAFSGELDEAWPVQGNYKPRTIYLSCGSSHTTELPAQSIDFVVTDPPFFDNVHYSELADFFLAWQSLQPHGFIAKQRTTRHVQEVQDANEGKFARKLTAVFVECHRVLKEQGLLVFTYHHSRTAGWTSLVEALFYAGFSVVNAHPVRSEMTVAVPKAQSVEPIQLDIVFVCRKRLLETRLSMTPEIAFSHAVDQSDQKLARLHGCGLTFSKNDIKIILISQLITQLSPLGSVEVVQQALMDLAPEIEQVVAALSSYNMVDKSAPTTRKEVAKVANPHQLSFDFKE